LVCDWLEKEPLEEVKQFDVAISGCVMHGSVAGGVCQPWICAWIASSGSIVQQLAPPPTGRTRFQENPDHPNAEGRLLHCPVERA
jgi:hypothetical protein